jgi:hypothetical protein
MRIPTLAFVLAIIAVILPSNPARAQAAGGKAPPLLTSIDPAKAMPADKAVVIEHMAMDYSTLPDGLLVNTSFAPLSLEESMKYDEGQRKLVFGFRQDSFLYWAYSIDPATRKTARKAFASSAISGDQGRKTCRNAFDAYMSALKPLTLHVTYREPTDPSLREGTQRGKDVYAKPRPQGIVWEAICLDPPLSLQMIRGAIPMGGYVPSPSGGKYMLNSFNQKLLIRPAPNPEALLTTIRPDSLYPGGYSIIDGRDRSGYDRKGYDRDGYDRLGWNAVGLSTSGDRWTGTLAAGRQGYGQLKQADGTLFVGRFLDDRPLGLCVAIKPSGEQEVQTWAASGMVDSRPVAGKIVSPSTQWIYLGEGSRDGLAEGRGGAISIDGRQRVEDGLFVLGRLVSGSLVLPDGTRLDGLFADEKLISGTIAGSDGSLYTGALANGLPEGKGTMRLADGTVYSGDFKAGTYGGEGVITRPDGEKYEGGFKNGKPHGMGIYVNGSTIERCEYYEGQRIDQAYQIRVENEKQLEAMRLERERVAKEKADQAEQARLAAERAAAQQKAQSEKSSNNLLRGLIGAGATMVVGSAIGLDTGTTLALAASAGVDMAKGDTSLSTMKATGQALGGGSASGGSPQSGGSAAPRATFAKRPNVLDSVSELSGGKWEKYSGDGQLYPLFQTAMVYYDAYLKAIAQGYSEAECNKTYDVHRQSAEYAISVWKGYTKK